MNKLTLLSAQINCTVGDIEENAELIITYSEKAKNEYNADIVIFPELALTGYPPEDLLFRPYLYKRVQDALNKICQSVTGITMIFGYPKKIEDKIYNAASVIHDGEIIATHFKQCLPNYTVFDENRYFKAGTKPTLFIHKGVRIGLIICEDLWHAGPLEQTKEAGAQLVISINASPFAQDKAHARRDLLEKRTHQTALPLIYVNMVGGQDELVFDGGSLVYDEQGKQCQQGKYFEEDFLKTEVSVGDHVKLLTHDPLPPEPLDEQKIYSALVLGVRDYVNKNKFPGAVIGLSGGIDSALTLAIAIDALGHERVETVMMPTRYTATISLEDAKTLAQNCNCRYSVINIDNVFEQFLKSLQEEFKGLPVDSTEENIQARCRGTILMAISNKKGDIVLTTGNKSEMAVGYATLYGDMAGGFSVLKDVYKTMVYKLCHYRNTIKTIIPARIIEREPSAELKENQKDQDFLPPYAILDEILERFIVLEQDAYTISDAGYDLNTVKKIVKMVSRNEYKRRQAPIGIRITERAFGKDRRYPITSGYFKKYDQF